MKITGHSYVQLGPVYGFVALIERGQANVGNSKVESEPRSFPIFKRTINSDGKGRILCLATQQVKDTRKCYLHIDQADQENVRLQAKELASRSSPQLTVTQAQRGELESAMKQLQDLQAQYNKLWEAHISREFVAKDS